MSAESWQEEAIRRGIEKREAIRDRDDALDALARAERDRDWNLRSSREAKKQAIQANARIQAALMVLDEDTRWQNEEHLLARVRAALTA